MNSNDWGDVIANEAKKWNGTDFRPGVKEQCMNWVRAVLERVSHPYAAKVTTKAVDGHWTGPALASSLAGRDLGEMITDISKLEAGDIVFWNDTYHVPGFGPGTITHVGIALSNEYFIHRNTMASPVNVQPYAGIWKRNFRCALRVPQQIKAEPAVKAPKEEPVESRTWSNSKGMTLELKEPLPPGRYTVVSAGGENGAWITKYVPK